MSNYNVVKLINNVTLVGDITETPEDVLINHPLEIWGKPIHNEKGKIVGEQMLLRPYLVMTKDTEVVIDTYNVLCFSKLDDRLINSYEEMVKNVYSDVQYDGNAFVPNDDEKEALQLTKEEAEYISEALDNLILNKDKTFH